MKKKIVKNSHEKKKTKYQAIKKCFCTSIGHTFFELSYSLLFIYLTTSSTVFYCPISKTSANN